MICKVCNEKVDFYTPCSCGTIEAWINKILEDEFYTSFNDFEVNITPSWKKVLEYIKKGYFHINSLKAEWSFTKDPHNLEENPEWFSLLITIPQPKGIAISNAHYLYLKKAAPWEILEGVKNEIKIEKASPDAIYKLPIGLVNLLCDISITINPGDIDETTFYFG
ncbi:MAG: hypothetical protein ACP5QP_07620 [Brevinematia bacterium]